jgi:methionine biosynthesis protein MetW
MNVRDFENDRWSQGPQSLEFRHAAAARLVQQDRVLDIGCGDGLLMSILADHGIAVTGMDISDEAVAACRARGFEAVRAEIGNDSLPFSDDAYPCVIALDVLEHLYDPGILLREMTRISSGAVIVGVPNFVSLPARLQVLFGRVPENNRPHKGHVYWFTWPVLTRLAEDAGLKLQRLETNTPWQRVPGIGPLLGMLARVWPGVFALSFVARFEVSSEV